MTEYLFVYSISPVQSFISQARKTQDFYAGSKLLSVLVDHILKKMSELVIDKYHANLELIFPCKQVDLIETTDIDERKSGIATTPNRFLVILKNIDHKDLLELGNSLEHEVQQILLSWGTKILDKHSITPPDLFKEQLTDYFQAYWSALDLSSGSYKDNYKIIESDLGAVKNIRTFSQRIQSHHKKCTICAQQIGIFYSETDGKILKNKKIIEKAIPIKNDKRVILASNELLCALCFLKRDSEEFLGKRNFPSTAEIALQTTFKEINEVNTKKLEQYQSLFGSDSEGRNNFEDQFYFKETLTGIHLQRYNISTKLETIIKAHKELKKRGKDSKNSNNSELDKIKFRKYYALIRFDGDDMGKILSGEYLVGKQKSSKLKNFHQNLSSFLSKFAEKVNNEFLFLHNTLVYAGGDDVLAFCPIDELIPSLQNLHELFKNEVDKKFKDNKQDYEIQKNLTASCGVCIAHYRTPLTTVLNWSSKMEKEHAKKIKDKNAFAIATLKHSGGIRFFRFKFEYLDEPNIRYSLEAIEKIVSLLQNGELSTTFIRDFEINYRSIEDPELIKPLLRRGIKRSINKDRIELSLPSDGDKKKLLKAKIHKIVEETLDSLLLLYKNSPANNDEKTDSNEKFSSMDNFVSLLDFLIFYSKEV